MLRVTSSISDLARIPPHICLTSMLGLLTLGLSAFERSLKGASDKRKVRLGHVISKRTMETVPGERLKVAV